MLTSFRRHLELVAQELVQTAGGVTMLGEQYKQILASMDAGKLTTEEGLGSMAAAFDDILAGAVRLGNTDAFEDLSESSRRHDQPDRRRHDPARGRTGPSSPSSSGCFRRSSGQFGEAGTLVGWTQIRNAAATRPGSTSGESFT